MASFKRRILLKRTINREKSARWAIDSFQAKTTKELLVRTTTNAVSLFQSPICALLLVKEDYLVIEAITGLDLEMIEPKQIPIGESLSGRLVKRGEPRLFLDVSHYIKTIQKNIEPYYSGSMATTPLVFNKQIIGLLNICRPAPSPPFSPEDLNRLITYGSQTAFAISSQRLVDKRTAELRAANEQLQQEIAERKKAEEKRERIERIVDNSQVILFHWLAETGWPVSFVSEGISQFGYTTDDFYSRRLDYAQIVYPEDLPRVADEVKAYLESRTDRFIQEYRIVTKSGDVRWLDDRTLVVRDHAGNIQRIEGTVLDITERKRAEETLRVSEKRYRTLVERMNEGLLLVDNNDVIQFANDRFAQMVGYSREELLGKVGYKLLLLEEDHEFLLEKNRLRTQGISDQYEIQCKRKSGEIIWVIISGSPVVDAQENVIGSVGIHTDITERKKAEEELQKRLGELEIYYRATIGRESRIIELKHQVNELLERLGEKKKYKV